MMKDLIIAGDIHYAPLWDKIQKIIPQFINPNENLRRLLSIIDKGKILILNGDLVDYNYKNYFRKKDSIWDEFFNILDKKNIEYYCNLGNHDYRLMPYNLMFFGLKYHNVPRSIWWKNRKEIGNYKIRGFNEILSVYSSKKVLRNYKFKRYYIKDIDNKRLIFLDTGPDGFTQLKYLHTIRHWLRLFSEHPNSLGLNKKQIKFLKDNIRTSKEIFIFIHCPTFFSRRKIRPIKLNFKNYRTALMWKIGYQKFILNNWKFIKILLESNSKINVISSHTHIPNYYLVDKRNRLLEQSTLDEINNERNNKNKISFISTLPLGPIRLDNKKIGYLKIGKKIEEKIMEEY